MQFDEDFFAAVGLGTATPEQRAQMVEQLAEVVQNRVAIRLSESLSENELEEFEKIAERDGDEVAIDYVQKVYPDYPVMVQGVIEMVKNELAQDVAETERVIREKSQQ